MARFAYFAPILSLLLLAACEEQVTEPESLPTTDAPLFKKGGKPGGGGGGEPANPAIAFRSNGALWVMNEDGSNATEVVPDEQYYFHPSWSPDGTKIVFQTSICGPLATVEVTVEGEAVTSSGYALIEATRGFECAGKPAWSPDGGKIAIGAGGSAGDLFTVTPDGLVLTQLTDTYGVGENDPAWSPAGDAIAYRWNPSDPEIPGSIKVYHLADQTVTTLVDFADYPEILETYGGFDLDWSRTEVNPRIAFSAVRLKKNSRVGALYTLSLDHSTGYYEADGPPEWLRDGNRGPSWSPTDDRIAVDGIDVYDLAGGRKVRLTRGQGPDWRR